MLANLNHYTASVFISRGGIVGSISEILWLFFISLSFAAFGILMFLLLPEHVDRARRAAMANPIHSEGVGLLSLFVVVPVLFLFAITILLLPLSFFILLCVVIAIIFGWVALGMEVGLRLSKILAREWDRGISVGVGTFMLTLTVYGLRLVLDFVPCVGWIIPTLAILLGLGAVVLSRFGTREYLL